MEIEQSMVRVHDGVARARSMLASAQPSAWQGSAAETFSERRQQALVRLAHVQDLAVVARAAAVRFEQARADAARASGWFVP